MNGIPLSISPLKQAWNWASSVGGSRGPEEKSLWQFPGRARLPGYGVKTSGKACPATNWAHHQDTASAWQNLGVVFSARQPEPCTPVRKQPPAAQREGLHSCHGPCLPDALFTDAAYLPALPRMVCCSSATPDQLQLERTSKFLWSCTCSNRSDPTTVCPFIGTVPQPKGTL